MFTLFLDNQLAVIKTDTSFKLTRENSYLHDAGDYTLDVTLPLSIPENQRIFGILPRLDIDKSSLINKRYKFELKADDVSLTGKAQVNQVTNEDIKIQLLAGKNNLSLDFKDEDGQDIYIDELDLGRAYEDVFRQQMGDSEYNMQNLIKMFIGRKNSGFDPDRYLYGLSSETECVNFPIFSTADTEFSNARFMNVFYNSDNTEDRFWTWPLSTDNQNKPYEGQNIIEDDLILAPQPYLYIIIERIFESLGYSVSLNQLKESWMANIFIANSRAALDYADILPHWTVAEFIQEIQRFLGVNILIDGNKIEIKLKKNLGHEESIELQEVVDSFTMDIDQDAVQLDSSTANIDYDWEEIDNWLKLPDEVFDYAKIKHFKTYSEAQEFVNNMSQEELESSQYIIYVDDIYKSLWDIYGKNKYAIVADDNNNFALREVDMMSALYHRNTRDIDIKLRFVPVCISYNTTTLRSYKQDSSGYHHYNDAPIRLYTLTTSDTRAIDNIKPYSVNDVIRNNSNRSDKRDIIEVAWNQGSSTPVYYNNNSLYGKDVPIAIGIPYKKDFSGSYLFAWPDEMKFQLTYTGEGIARDALNFNFGFDARGKICVSFIDTGNFSPDKIYLIGGKKYICDKLEFSISDHGLDRIKKGYFYPIS